MKNREKLNYTYIGGACMGPHWGVHIKLPTGSEERGVLAVGNVPVAILPSCQNIKQL